MRLVPASLQPPSGLEAFLRELGQGENGYGGSELVTSSMSLREYLQRQVEYAGGLNLDEGHVPQTTYWLLDSAGEVAGMLRLRHRLNERLLQTGGHIGYYIRPSARGRGYGREILRFGLEEARRLGIDRVLLTVNADNLPSIRVIEANGGVMQDESPHPDDGRPYRRYWIDLSKRPS